jgi:hypothetical protein
MIMHMILHMVEQHGGPAIPRQQGNLVIGHKANSISARLGFQPAQPLQQVTIFTLEFPISTDHSDPLTNASPSSVPLISLVSPGSRVVFV